LWLGFSFEINIFSYLDISALFIQVNYEKMFMSHSTIKFYFEVLFSSVENARRSTRCICICLAANMLDVKEIIKSYSDGGGDDNASLVKFFSGCSEGNCFPFHQTSHCFFTGRIF